MNAELIQYLERVESVREEIKDKRDDEKAVFAEIKATGYDTKLIRAILVLRAMDAEKRQEYQALLDTYMEEAGLTNAG